MSMQEPVFCTLKDFASIAEKTSKMATWEQLLRRPKLEAASRLTVAKEARMFAAHSVTKIRDRINLLLEQHLSIEALLPHPRDRFELYCAFADVEVRDALVDCYRKKYDWMLRDGLIPNPDPEGMDLHAAIHLADARVLARETLDIYEIEALKAYGIFDEEHPFGEAFNAYDMNVDPLPAVTA